MSATKTPIQNMAQAAADLLAIKAAIVAQGVEVPANTPTSDYATLIAQIGNSAQE